MAAQDLFPQIQSLELSEQLELLDFLVQIIRHEVIPAPESQQAFSNSPSIDQAELMEPTLYRKDGVLVVETASIGSIDTQTLIASLREERMQKLLSL